MANVAVDKKALVEGERPMYNTSYGKLMMWFFLVTDAFTFSALLIGYGTLRVSSVSKGLAWANPEVVFTHFPLLYELFHIKAPLAFVGLMTFILILSSVTMVLAVEAGHRKSKKEVEKWVLYTIIGGVAFLSCQAYEWYHFIHGTEQGAFLFTQEELAQEKLTFNVEEYMESHGGEAAHGDHAHPAVEGVAFLPVRKVAEPGEEVGEIAELRLRDGFRISNSTLLAKANAIDQDREGNAAHLIEGGSNLKANEYGPPAFADLFFFVTGFHGTHVFSGVILLIILWLNVRKGTYEKRGHYEMTEKIGLYWHFVDLVWVFVFTFFYLV